MGAKKQATPMGELGVEVCDDYGSWINDVIGHIGQYVNLETQDGCRRGGRVTGVRCHDMLINGIQRSVPVAVELNDDPNDAVELLRIVKIQYN